ncbi:hypothetical protein TSMEX_003011 [Taenia solium]|eukprot:TsM_000457600 transcript=TsM_000457600 gene=TsM_000457600
MLSLAEIGDIDKLEDYLGANGSLADLKMFENMTPRVEDKIRELYKTLRGLSAAEAEGKFLERASELETYGVEPVFVQVCLLAMSMVENIVWLRPKIVDFNN